MSFVFPFSRCCSARSACSPPRRRRAPGCTACRCSRRRPNAVRYGFVRIVNESDEARDVVVRAFDDAGTEYGPVTLAIGAGEVRHFNSRDLETGNVAKGLTGSTGPPQAGRRWRLSFESDLEIRVLGYVRTRGAQGFPNAMHEVVTERRSEAGYRYEVAFLNPASNLRQASLLRLVNRANAEAAVTIAGLDDAGVPGEAAVALTLPAGAARLLSAPALESGAQDLAGALGDGTGKWRLSVASDQPLAVMSLMQGPGGHLTNLSTAPPGHLPAFTVTIAECSPTGDLQQGLHVVLVRGTVWIHRRINSPTFWLRVNGVQHGAVWPFGLGWRYGGESISFKYYAFATSSRIYECAPIDLHWTEY